MGFDRRVRYSATCDVRTDQDGNRWVIPFGAFAAWEAAGAPHEGPLWEALGQGCPARSDDVWAKTPALGRKEMEAAGWTFKIRYRHAGVVAWGAACPAHKDML